MRKDGLPSAGEAGAWRPGALPPRLRIGVPGSGSGKTTVTLGLLRAFRDTGLAVQPFKNGPDYVDPAFPSAAAGRASFNLDGWAMGEDLLGALARRTAGADLLVAEGSMGLYDGTSAPGRSGRGAASEIARRFGWPVVLALDVGGQAQAAAATALGFAQHPEAPDVAGVILNNVSGARHEVMIRREMARLGLTVLGALPRRSDLVLPERHLGFVQGGEHPDLETAVARPAALLRYHDDLGAVRAAARRTLAPGAGPLPAASGLPHRPSAAPLPRHGAGARLAGHEVHYSTILEQPDPPLARATDADGNPVPETGSGRGPVTSRFFHPITAETP
ncbi:AAA family ATPase [Cereibacter sphaeroides]|uniref:nucleotide-binding protein n=1 Tax=Cereibacter sphaeroides TaxID=1063 RepID=UPI003990ADE9